MSSVVGVVVAIVVLERLQQATQLAADEVAGGDLADAEAQARDLAGEELHVGVGLRRGLAVLLLLDPVARLLPVLREQDERGGVRRLQRQDQRQEDEWVLVPARPVRA